jgi:hypothetical protein
LPSYIPALHAALHSMPASMPTPPACIHPLPAPPAAMLFSCF